jgi:gluconokinase
MILALDLGSSSTRATLYADDLAPINEGSARALVSFTVDDYGRNEDALDAAWQRLTQTLDAISPVAMRHQPVTRLAVASYATSLVCLDAAGTALTPVFTYADTRAASAARALRERQDETAALSRTGCRIRANYWPARLAWLRETQPETIAHTRYFCSLIDALALHLFGRTATGISVSAWTGLVNTLQRDWDDAWLNTLGIERAQLPEILPHGASLVGLLPEWARRWPWI